MGRLQSTVGLLSGVPIQDTVEQLLSISARPRDLLVSRNNFLQAEQVAVTELTARVLGVQFSLSSLKLASTFNSTVASSSSEAHLTATTTGQPAAGTYQFTPIQQAQTHQALSSGFSTRNEPIGEGELKIGFGGFVDETTHLNNLNGGLGVSRGKIKITDRNGDSATVDLRFAQTIDDVLEAINAADGIEVTATTEGDAIHLSDSTGSTSSNLKVEEVGGGQTAADLGLGGIDTATNAATGADIVSLYDNLALSELNDGNGIRKQGALSDLEIFLADGTILFGNFDRIGSNGGTPKGTTVSSIGRDSEVVITAKTNGTDFDKVTVVFENDDSVTQGNETVEYDGSDPENRKLIFKIDDGFTTADDIVNALNNDIDVGADFEAALHTDGDGSGLITLTDTGFIKGGSAKEARKEQTLGDILETLNEIDPTRLEAKISASGDRIELVDKTTGTDTFQVQSAFGSGTAEDLGLTGESVGGTLSSRRLLSGLSGPLLSTLGGGQSGGLGTLGTIDLTDRSGATASVDLSAAETLEDVLTAINAAGVGIEASVNSVRHGIELKDTTGATASNLIVANADATNSADLLSIAVDDAVTSVDSGSFGRQTVSHQTLLDDLNAGQGVAKGQFVIHDTAGKSSVIDLRPTAVKTVGDVIKEINDAAVGVTARINDTGDGIIVIDTGGGQGNLKITEIGGAGTAGDLGLAGTAEVTDIGGELKQVLDGAAARTIEIEATDSLEDVVGKINSLGVGVSASIFNDGSGNRPYRLQVTSDVSGHAGELLLDTSGADFTFETLVDAQDALLLFGSSASSAGVLTSSSTNRFNGVVEGLALTVQAPSTETVTITVNESDNKAAAAAEQFVNQYNTLRAVVKEVNFYDETTGEKGVLFGTNVALRIDSDLPRLITGRFFGVGDIQTLAEVGVNIKDDGTLSFDRQKFSDAFARDREAVQEFFSDPDLGVVKKVESLIDTLAGAGNSLLVNRADSLQRKINTNNERIANHNIRLASERERLLNEFFAMEEAIGKLQGNLTALQALQPLPPLTLNS